MIPIRDTIQARRTPVVTYILILINTLVFLYELRIPPGDLESVIRYFGLVPVRILKPHLNHLAGMAGLGWMSLVTSMFLHGGWLHIVGNMWTLYLFGDNVEDRLGHMRFLLFYVFSGLAAGLSQVFLHPNMTIPTVGASGAIAGIMGAYFVLFPHSRIIVLFPVFFYPLFLEVPAVLYLFMWFLTQVYSGTFTIFQARQDIGGVAFWAHVGGFVAGLILLLVFIPRGKKKPRKRFEDEYYPW